MRSIGKFIVFASIIESTMQDECCHYPFVRSSYILVNFQLILSEDAILLKFLKLSFGE
jgi:hypothetical protein